MIRYVTYKRVSTKDQGRSGLGLEAQERDIGIFLETYSEEPWEVIGKFTDIQSGTEDDRPELLKAIDLAKREKATLLVAKVDRLSRRAALVLNLMEDKRLKLRVAVMPYADKFQLQIYAILAEQERDFISQRTKAALREAKGRGKQLGGLRDKTMKRNAVLKAQADERAKKLEGLVRPLQESGASLQAIADALNGASVATPRGGDWYPSSVSRLLARLV